MIIGRGGWNEKLRCTPSAPDRNLKTNFSNKERRGVNRTREELTKGLLLLKAIVRNKSEGHLIIIYRTRLVIKIVLST